MNLPDETTAPRPATASSALLTAALSGLLCLTTACAPAPRPNDGSADATQSPDTAAQPDVTAQPDVSAQPDSATQPDAAEEPDAGATDASVPPMDASADASTDVALSDARPHIDETCDVVPDRSITSTDAAFGMTLEIFTAMCDRAGGWIEIHPHCGGANSCRGFSYDEGIHVFTEHTCAGLNTCNGYSCVLPDGV